MQYNDIKSNLVFVHSTCSVDWFVSFNRSIGTQTCKTMCQYPHKSSKLSVRKKKKKKTDSQRLWRQSAKPDAWQSAHSCKISHPHYGRFFIAQRTHWTCSQSENGLRLCIGWCRYRWAPFLFSSFSPSPFRPYAQMVACVFYFPFVNLSMVLTMKMRYVSLCAYYSGHTHWYVVCDAYSYRYKYIKICERSNAQLQT